MNKILEWTIDLASIEESELDSDSESYNKIMSAKSLIKSKASPTDVVKALGDIYFEWDWQNCDEDPSVFVRDTDSIRFLLNDTNSTITARILQKHLVITASVRFKLSVHSDIVDEEFSAWLEEVNAKSCGFVSGGWSYSGDAWQSVNLLSGG